MTVSFEKPDIVLVRGGGDLASGAALRLWRAGIRVAIAELPQPLMVRRRVAFAEAVYAGQTQVEEIEAVRVEDSAAAQKALEAGQLPVLVDPELKSLEELEPVALVDGRMTKQAPERGSEAAPLVVGLGPGFVAGENCHAVVETMRGHSLGRVYWQGAAAADTGIPGSIASYKRDRVLRAPADGQVAAQVEIGERVKTGALIAEVNGEALVAPFDGVLRGLVHPSLTVKKGMKIGDLDPRNEPSYCFQVSDKALAVGGGVLEAVLARPEIRKRLWA